MQFWRNAVFAAIFKTKIRSRAAIDLGTVLSIAGFTLFRLNAFPIKRNCCRIEVFFECLPVCYVVLFLRKLIQHKYICTEIKSMTFLMNSHIFICKRLSVFIFQNDFFVTLAVLFNITLTSEIFLLPFELQFP